MKKFLIILVVIVVILVATVAVLVANLDKVVDSKKDYVLGKAEAALDREITVEDIGVTLSRGIGVKLTNVALADDPAYSDERFVTAKDLTIRVKFWPLLKKQVEIKRLVLNEPIVNIIRDEGGVFNYATLGSAQGAGGAGADESDLENVEPVTAASLVLAFADIKNGTIRFEDRQNKLDLEVGRIDVTAENAGLGQVASIQFAAAVLAEKQNVKLEGKVGPVERVDTPDDLRPTPVQLKVSLGPLDLGALRQIVPDHPKLDQLETLGLGTIQGALTIGGTLGALDVSQAEFTTAVLDAESPNVTLRAQAGPVDVLAAAESGPPSVAFSGDIELTPIPLEKLREMLESAGNVPPELALSGEAEVTARFKGDRDGISVDAFIDVTEGSIRFADKFQKPAGISSKAGAKLTVTSAAADIEQFTFTMGPLVANGEGRVDFAGTSPALDVSVRSNPTDAAGLAELLPALEPFSLGGTLTLLAKARGALEPNRTPSVEGSIQLRDGSAKLEQMPEPVTDANATIEFTDKSARVENATLRIGQSALRLDGRATSFQPLKADYRLTSSEVHRADFQTPPKPSPRPEVLRNVNVEGQIWQEGETVRYEGRASSPSGSIANVDYQELTASIASVQDRIDIQSFSAKTLGGTVEGNGSFRPKDVPPKFEVTTRVRQVNLVEYFRYKVESIPNFIEGSIDLDLEVAGAGQQWEEISPTLTGKGGALIVKGALLNVNIANELFSGLEQLPLIDRNAINDVRQKNPKLFSSNNTAFKDLRADVRIDGGRVHSKGMVLKAADYTIYGDGWISFDRQLSIRSNIVFSNQATQNIINQLKEAKYLTNDNGQLELPVMLTGQLGGVTVAPDLNLLSKALQNAGVDQLRDQVEDQVKDFLKGFGKKSSSKQDTTKKR
jgi:hypothetical protein